MDDYGWKNVTKSIIRNCFIKARFFEYITSNETEEVDFIKQEAEEELKTESRTLEIDTKGVSHWHFIPRILKVDNER